MPNVYMSSKISQIFEKSVIRACKKPHFYESISYDEYADDNYAKILKVMDIAP